MFTKLRHTARWSAQESTPRLARERLLAGQRLHTSQRSFVRPARITPVFSRTRLSILTIAQEAAPPDSRWTFYEAPRMLLQEAKTDNTSRMPSRAANQGLFGLVNGLADCWTLSNLHTLSDKETPHVTPRGRSSQHSSPGGGRLQSRSRGDVMKYFINIFCTHFF